MGTVFTCACHQGLLRRGLRCQRPPPNRRANSIRLFVQHCSRMSAELCVKKSTVPASPVGSVAGEVQSCGGRRTFGRRSIAGCSSLLVTGPAALLFRLTLLLRIHVRHIPRHWFKLPVMVAGTNLFPRRWLLGADTPRSHVVHVITVPITVGLIASPITSSSRCFNVGAALLFSLRLRTCGPTLTLEISCLLK